MNILRSAKEYVRDLFAENRLKTKYAAVLFPAMIILFTVSCTSEDLMPTVVPSETTGEIYDTPFPGEPTDFVEDIDENQYLFAPGIIMLKLKTPTDSSLEALFPNLNIEEYQDIDERTYNKIKDAPGFEEQAEAYRSRIGTNFMIVLTEKTPEAVIRGIELLRENPNVDYAQPDYIANPADSSFVPELNPSSSLPQITDSPHESTVPESESPEEKTKLLINGKNIADGHYVKLNYEYRYAELPFVSILEELGAETNRTGENTVSLHINDKTYILNTEKCTLTEENSKLNLFQVAPGDMHGVISKIVNNEFVIDSDSAKLFINVILKLKMNVDFNDKTITISEN